MFEPVRCSISSTIRNLNVPGSNADIYAQVEPNIAKPESSDISLSACIRPQTSRTDSCRQILENVLMHRMFGVTEFFVYDAGLTTSFVNVLNKIEDRTIRLKILPWNLPSELIAKSVAKVLVQVLLNYWCRD